MKKITLTLIILTLTALFTSCKSTGGHCDAYGNKSANVEELDFDIYSSHNSDMSKYGSTVSIK
jgi:hypothetical protein